MSWSNEARNAMLAGAVSLIDRIGIAGADGDEFAGANYNGPFTPSWGDPSDGIVEASPAVVTVPAGVATWILYMTDGTPETIHAMFPYMAGTTDPIVGVGVASSSADTIASDAHGLSNGDRLALYPLFGGSLPTGLSGPPTLYYVVDASTDSFSVSTTQGGSAVDFSADGELLFVQGLPETFAAPGSTTVTPKLSADLV